MIDYIYSDIKGISPGDFYDNALLDFSASVNLKTGELSPFNNRDREKKGYTPKDRKEAVYNHCKFIITNDKYINFSGSLHEYYHKGENHCDFTFPELFYVIKDFNRKFDINPFLNPIHNIEFGVNVRLPFETKVVLNSIIVFKGKEYEMKRFKGRGYMIKFVFDQYELKIYDKGLHFELPENVLRFEIKVTSMHFLHSKGISIRITSDLLLPEIHQKLGAILIDFFNQVLMFDPSIKLNQLKNREKAILIEGQNPKYWVLLKESNTERYKKRVKRFKELVRKHGKSQLQKTVSDLIKSKWENLTFYTQEIHNNIDDFLEEMKSKTFPDLIAHEKTNIPRFNPSNSTLIQGNMVSIEKRFCRTCGKDISGQKPGSIFCSEKVYGKEAKKCRNKDSNPRNNFLFKEAKIKSRGLLFDISPYLKTSLINSIKFKTNAIQKRKIR